MKWRIEGADKITGKDIQTVLDAHDEDAARILANISGVVVSSVSEASNLDDLAEPTGEGFRAPEYRDIMTGADWLRIYAQAVQIVGILSIIGGIVGFVIAASQSSGVAAIVAVILIGSGISGLLASAVVRMLASIGLAIRDTARNSWIE